MTYNDALATNLDRARALLGDTSDDPTTELVTDDHITAAISLYAFEGGVAFVAQGLAARYAREPGTVRLPSGFSATWSERVAYWKELAKQMRMGAIAGAAGVAPYAGGISIADKQTVEEDSDRVVPAFTRDDAPDPNDSMRVIP